MIDPFEMMVPATAVRDDRVRICIAPKFIRSNTDRGRK